MDVQKKKSKATDESKNRGAQDAEKEDDEGKINSVNVLKQRFRSKKAEELVTSFRNKAVDV